MPMPLLAEALIRELYEAAIAAGLARCREALMAGIDGRFVAGIGTASSPAAQLLVDLHALNDAGALEDGKVPLGIWLANAAQLAGPRIQAAVFARARDGLSVGRSSFTSPATGSSPPPAPSFAPQPVDIGIIVALKEETAELLDLADDYTPHGDGGMNSYLFTRSGYRCAVTFVGAMGDMEAARISERHIQLFDPESILSIGISGGVHDDLRVGDVYVPTHAVQYMQDSKASPTEAGGFIIRPGAPVTSVDDHLHTAAIGFAFNHKAVYRQWREDCRKDFEALLPDVASRERLVAEGLVRREVGLLAEGHEASGPVVSGASAFSAWIQSHDRNVKAVDMECAAVVRAAEARKHRKRALVIRGISDYGDPRKKDLDAVGGGSLRKYAMRNAVRFLWALLDAEALPRNPR